MFLQISEMEDWRNSFLPARSLARRSMAGSTSWGLGYASDPPSIFDITLVESDERSRKTHADFMGSASLVHMVSCKNLTVAMLSILLQK